MDALAIRCCEKEASKEFLMGALSGSIVIISGMALYNGTGINHNYRPDKRRERIESQTGVRTELTRCV